ncbi:MAG: Asp-tRNA(Asn)/Glu-tRNA(Gln) amidotransferase subunit GatC [Bacteroidetes bacterium]|nr:Asp-tRNA(Asn)/Glu-tRNA(Gln) amidotransferase subunit GatC [Bacteroidota bacterium]
MSVTLKDVQYIAALAHLEFTQAETEAMQKDMNAVLEYMEQLGQVDTSGVEPLRSMTGELENVFRDDEEKPCLPNETALSNAPAKLGPFFRVPKVIEQL